MPRESKYTEEQIKGFVAEIKEFKASEYQRVSLPHDFTPSAIGNWCKDARYQHPTLGLHVSKPRKEGKKSANVFLHKEADVRKYLEAIIDLQVEQDAIDELEEQITADKTKLNGMKAALITKQIAAKDEAGL